MQNWWKRSWTLAKGQTRRRGNGKVPLRTHGISVNRRRRIGDWELALVAPDLKRSMKEKAKDGLNTCHHTPREWGSRRESKGHLVKATARQICWQTVISLLSIQPEDTRLTSTASRGTSCRMHSRWAERAVVDAKLMCMLTNRGTK